MGGDEFSEFVELHIFFLIIVKPAEELDMIWVHHKDVIM